MLNDEKLVDLPTHAEGVVLESVIHNPSLIDEHQITAKYFESELKPLFIAAALIKRDGMVLDADLINIRLLDIDCNLSEVPGLLEIFHTLKRQGGVSPNLDYYVGLLKERAFKQELDTTIMEVCIAEQAPDKKASKLINSLSAISTAYTASPRHTFMDDINAVLKIADDAVHGIFPRSLKSGFAELDKVLGEGILDEYLWIFAAPSFVGKSTFALNVIRHIAMRHKHRCAYVSLEMSRVKVMTWFLSACTSIPTYNFTNGKMTTKEFGVISEVISSHLCPDALDVLTGDTDVNSVLSRLAQHIKTTPECRFIVIDHFHLLTHANMTNPIDAQKRIIDAIKTFTLKHKVPILLLAQFKKEDETAQKRDPIPGDINGSSAVMTNADVLMLAKNDTSLESNLSQQYRFIKIFTPKNRSSTDYYTPFVRIGQLRGTMVMADRPISIPHLHIIK